MMLLTIKDVFHGSPGVVAELTAEASLPLTPLKSCYADDLGGIEGVEAVHEGDADFGSLAVRASRGDALAEGLEAAHLGLNAAADVVSRPPFPERQP